MTTTLGMRKSARSNLTRIVNETLPILGSETRNLRDLEERLVRLNAAWARLKEATDACLPTMDPEQAEQEWDQIFSYEGTAVSTIYKLESAIKESQEVRRRASSEPSITASGSGAQTKLPRLEIQKFGGDLEKWLPFWELFEKQIHSNTDLDDAEKFAYLQSYLIGKAARSLDGLIPTAACYNEAINLLKKEYGQNDRLKEGLYKRLAGLRKIKHSNDSQCFRKLYNEIMVVSRSLQAMGVPMIQYAVLLKTTLLDCLPETARLEFRRKIRARAHHYPPGRDSVEIEAERLVVLLKEEVDLLEEDAATRPTEMSKPHVDREKRHHEKQRPFSTAELHTRATELCLFCKQGGHECADFMSKIELSTKKEQLKAAGRCFRCTRAGHNARFCRVRVKCGNCGRQHATAVCDPEYANRMKTVTENTVPADEVQTHLITANVKVHLETAVARIHQSAKAPEGSLIRILVDGGSETTFIKEEVSRQLQLPIVGRHAISIRHFGSVQKPPPRLCNIVKFALRCRHTNRVIELTAVETPNLCSGTFIHPNPDSPELTDFALADVGSPIGLNFEGISLLIGADQYWDIVTGVVQKLRNGLRALETKIGWIIHGKTEGVASISTASVLLTQVEEVDVSRLWDLDAVGIKEEEKVDNEFAEQFMDTSVQWRGERYEARLPWKHPVTVLHDNFPSAKSRLVGLITKLRRQDRFDEYDAIIKEYLQLGIVERVDTSQRNERDHIYYMPHRAVYREERETTRVRIVFDASSHVHGHESLNSVLHVGTGMVPDLVKIILRFRLHMIGMVADIEKAFLQVSLVPEDRDSHRFLWVEEGRIVTYRMNRVTFGVASSPFMLASVIKKHLKQTNNETARLIERSIYVDDVVMGANNLDHAKRIHKEAVEIMSGAGMVLRKWHSNHDGLRFHLQDTAEEQKVLGMRWQLLTDEILVDTTSLQMALASDRSPTKRNVLQAIARIYDPLGMVSPYIITLKLLMQDVWRENIGWDAELNDDHRTRWNQWIEQVPILDSFRVPRHLGLIDEAAELHVFCDASVKAYGAVAYLRRGNNSRFLMARARVAPVKSDNLTLPRLELTAALMGSRLARYLRSTLAENISETTLWSDSRIALYWIKAPPEKWKLFVANRVREIQQLSHGSIWKHCPGKCNPADLLTRGFKASELIKSQLWLEGPEFLKDEELQPPNEDDGVTEQTEELLGAFQVSATRAEPQVPDAPIFDIYRFSNFGKLIQVTVYVLRFVNALKARDRTRDDSVGTTKDELRNAEGYWLRFVQTRHYPEEIDSLRQTKPIPRGSNLLKLCPFLDVDGIMRLQGRLNEAELTFDEKHPIILPRRSGLDELLIKHAHERLHHGGVNQVLSELRNRYWLIKGRPVVKSVLARCIICQRLRKLCATAPPAPLPRERLRAARAFDHVGIDFAGPLYLKVVNDETQKAYILLLTCSVTRALHLELVPNMGTEAFVRAMTRFFARRGVPERILSDNALTFKKAARELNELQTVIRSARVDKALMERHVKWKFNVELAPWWGGFWERMVRTVKNALRATLRRQTLTFDEMATVLTEIEATINSRPLTYVGSCPTDVRPLRPLDFIIGSGDAQLEITDRGSALNAWSARTAHLVRFWKRWSNEYLQQLKSAHEGNTKRGTQLKVGSVCLLKDLNTKRIHWRMARIQELFKGRDNKPRSCEVILGNGTILRRPIQLIVPLELEDAP